MRKGGGWGECKANVRFNQIHILNDLIWCVVARRWTLSSLHPPSLGAFIGKWYFGFLSTYLRLSSQPCRILTEYSRRFRLYFINRSLISRWLLFTFVFSYSNSSSFVLLPIKNDAWFAWERENMKMVIFYVCRHTAPSLTWRMVLLIQRTTEISLSSTHPSHINSIPCVKKEREKNFWPIPNERR